jgi:hypothetical protein
MGAVLAIAASGCGGDSSETTTASARGSETGGAAETTATAPPRAPNYEDAKQRVVESIVPDIRSQLRQDGVQAFGDTAIQCAPTGGPETECLIEVPFIRHDQCGIARRRVLVTVMNGEIVTAPDSPDESKLVPEICYIAANGESVPSPP